MTYVIYGDDGDGRFYLSDVQKDNVEITSDYITEAKTFDELGELWMWAYHNKLNMQNWIVGKIDICHVIYDDKEDIYQACSLTPDQAKMLNDNYSACEQTDPNIEAIIEWKLKQK